MSKFSLNSISNGLERDDYFVLSIENNHNIVRSLKTNKQHQIFPYSSHLHSFNPYNSEKRSWKTYDYTNIKPNKMAIDSLLNKNVRSKFWFNSFYDTYADTIYAHFKFKDPETNNISKRTFWKTFDKKVKPNINYEIEEVERSKLNNYDGEILLSIDGPFTYFETNKLLNTKIDFEIDSKEVFHLNVRNTLNDTIIIKRWANNEILMDTIYSYNTFTQSSKEKQWNFTRYNKSEIPIDTIKIFPQQSNKFWFKFELMNPTIDSIAFEKTFETNSQLITRMKLYIVKKIKK